MRFLVFCTTISCLSPVFAGLTYVGVDWSSVVVEERSGITYKTANGTAQPLELMLKSSGVNTVRQRVWVNPRNGDYGLAYNLALGKRAKAAGLGIYLDFHYSDTWADPAHQTIPSGWPTDIESLSGKLYNYTLEVANQFQANDLHPTIVSIGNEIRGGLLWPTGRTSSYANIARLLRSAALAIKDSALNPKPKIMIHLDNGWDWSAQQYFYKTVLAQGTLAAGDFDMMGVSYYPFYGAGATLAALGSSLANMAAAWGKELVVAETNWPTACPSARTFPTDLQAIPFSVAGQVDFVRKVAAAVAGTKNGTGLFYWEPAWVDNQALGSSCSSNTMFAYPGTALSSLSVFSSI